MAALADGPQVRMSQAEAEQAVAKMCTYRDNVRASASAGGCAAGGRAPAAPACARLSKAPRRPPCKGCTAKG